MGDNTEEKAEKTEDNTEEIFEESEDSTEEKVENSRKKYYWIVGIILVGALLIGSVFSGSVDVLAWFNGEPQEEQVQMNDEDGFEAVRPQLEQMLAQEKEREVIIQHLEDLRDASEVVINQELLNADDKSVVVALVNGEEIKREDMLELEEQEKQQMLMMGIDPEGEEAAQMMEHLRPQIVDHLIINAVMHQKIEEEGVTVSDDEVEEYYQQYALQFGGEEMMEQQLAQAGYTKEDLRQEIIEQLPIQNYLEKFVEENLDEDALNFSEAELRELYEAQQQQMQQQQQQIPAP